MFRLLVEHSSTSASAPITMTTATTFAFKRRRWWAAWVVMRFQMWTGDNIDCLVFRHDGRAADESAGRVQERKSCRRGGQSPDLSHDGERLCVSFVWYGKFVWVYEENDNDIRETENIMRERTTTGATEVGCDIFGQ